MVRLCALVVCFWLGLCGWVFAAIDPDQLLPPERAFVPTLEVGDEFVRADFQIADGYYLYQSKIVANTDVPQLLAEPTFSLGKEKDDEFFGKQVVYYHSGSVTWAMLKQEPSYTLTLQYQGCADVGVCYPPVETTFQVSGSGVYMPPGHGGLGESLLKKLKGETVASVSPLNNSVDDYHRFQLSRGTLWSNLLAFFIAGVALSFTACMYPLLPIVSSIVVGDKHGSKMRAFCLSFVYVQGLAVTYTLVGMIAGRTGALLTVWLQQAWVVLTASFLMVLLALAMFGVFHLQLPAVFQSYVHAQSRQLSGGKVVSVLVMGMLSALIVGPCVAPPLAFALGYIGQTGDAWLGGVALYSLALGMGLPLMLIATFGGHVLPKAGAWMNGIRYVFGVILLAVAVYLATPFIGYYPAVIVYTLLLFCSTVYLLFCRSRFAGSLKMVATLLATGLAVVGVWFMSNSIWQGGTTPIHRFLTLYAPSHAQSEYLRVTDVAQLNQAIEQAWITNPNEPVLLDFYADWCISCKEMESKTFQHAEVKAKVPMHRLIQIDVTENTAEHQALLREYGLYGPPGLFILNADGTRSPALLGYMPAQAFIEWYQAQMQK